MNSKAIHTEKLTKHYGKVRAVEALDLTIERGEVFGFLGPNGAGKTTAMRTLLDLLRPTSGKATLLGLDSHKDAVEIRKHIGYLPGELSLYGSLTGRQLLEYFANLRGGVDEKYVDELAQRFNADLDVKISEYSTSNKQKIGLIQAFMNKPDLLLLDEPSTGLDPLVQQEFQSLVRECSKEGRTIFLSSHTLSEVNHVADRVGIIRKGKLVVTETMTVLKQKGLRHVAFEFESAPGEGAFEKVEGVRSASYDSKKVDITFEGAMNELLKASTQFGVVTMNTSEGDLEDIFLSYYRDEPEEQAQGGRDA